MNTDSSEIMKNQLLLTGFYLIDVLLAAVVIFDLFNEITL